MATLTGLPQGAKVFDPQAVADDAKRIQEAMQLQNQRPAAQQGLSTTGGFNPNASYETGRMGGVPSMASVAQPSAPAPIATPETRTAPTADQGMNWAKAAQAAVKGFGKTPPGQDIQNMEERGLVRDAQGRWVPGEALQQAVEANYQAGVAARNPMVQPAPAIDPVEAELSRYNPTTGFGALAALAAAKSKVASDYTASQNAIRAGERQQELGLRDLATRLQGRELELKAEEAPVLRALREAQTQQAIAEAGLTSEKKRLYPKTIEQSTKAAEAKAQGATIAKLQDNILRLRRDLSKAVMPEEKAATQKLIKDQEVLLSRAML